jgi:hypothetical protein
LKTAFTWPRSPVRLQQGGPEGFKLVLAAETESPSEAPEVAGFWMRLAAMPRTHEAFAAFAGRYGFLRRAGEETAQWFEMTRLLAHMAEPWGYPWDHPSSDMPFPKAGRAAAIALAHEHGKELRHQALSHADLVLDAGETGFRVVPRNLAGFLALTASAALIEKHDFRRCLQCREWFAVGRADQKFCTARHRWLERHQTDKER